MVLLKVIPSLFLLILVESSPLERKKAAICEFFQNVEAFQDDQWTDSVDLLKILLRQTISVTSPYSEYINLTSYMQENLDRGKSVTRSSSVQTKMQYWQTFFEFYDTPFLDINTAKGKQLHKPYEEFQPNIVNVCSTLYRKVMKAAEDMKKIVGTSDKSELFSMLNEYESKGLGEETVKMASRILALKNQYECV